MFQKIKLLVLGSVMSVGSLAALPAMAAGSGVDYSGITGAADWTAVGAGIITVLGAVALVYVALTGGKKLLSAFRA